MLHYAVDWAYLLSVLPDLLRALLRTLYVSGVGIIGSVAIGLLAVTLGSFSRLLLFTTMVYVEIMRNVPHLVVIVFLYFGLPEIGIKLPTVVVASIVLSLVEGAYNVEALRGSFGAVPARYRRAGQALGLSETQCYLYITIPNGLRIAAPAVGNNCISVVKNSTLLMVIGYPELMSTTVADISSSFRVYELLAVMAAMYLIIISLLSTLLRTWERRMLNLKRRG